MQRYQASILLVSFDKKDCKIFAVFLVGKFFILTKTQLLDND